VLITRAASARGPWAGSGNIGATNVFAPKSGAAVLTLALDAAKGAAAVLLARAVAAGEGAPPDLGRTLESCAAFAAVAGHVFSPWLRLKGGKGVATAAGAVLVLSPVLFAAGLAVFALTFAVSRIVSLSSIAAILGAGLFAAADRWAGWGTARVAILPLAGIAMLVLVRHAANVGRILKGDEAPCAAGSGRGGCVSVARRSGMTASGDRPSPSWGFSWEPPRAVPCQRGRMSACGDTIPKVREAAAGRERPYLPGLPRRRRSRLRGPRWRYLAGPPSSRSPPVAPRARILCAAAARWQGRPRFTRRKASRSEP
jgi:glycerol-3-phosphate acyltransferase PlsY